MITVQTMLDRLPAGDQRRPLLEAMFVRNEWLLRPMLEYLEPAMLDRYLDDVGEIWRIQWAIRPMDVQARLDEVIRGLQFHSVEFLKLQIQFAKSGEYRSSDFEKVYETVYSAEPVMQQYLDGLLLTYIAWPNHFRMLNWYREKYLAQGSYGRCLEIGPGHGWLALEQLRANPSNTLVGLDVSPHSVRYTTSVLTAAGIDRTRFDVRETDAEQALTGDVQPFERIVIAEVIEHLEDPTRILKLAVRHAQPNALFFITTVVNIEAVDHIYLFRELDEVRAMMDRCGLRVVDELDLELKMNLKLPKPAYEVALICKPG